MGRRRCRRCQCPRVHPPRLLLQRPLIAPSGPLAVGAALLSVAATCSGVAVAVAVVRAAGATLSRAWASRPLPFDPRRLQRQRGGGRLLNPRGARQRRRQRPRRIPLTSSENVHCESHSFMTACARRTRSIHLTAPGGGCLVVVTAGHHSVSCVMTAHKRLLRLALLLPCANAADVSLYATQENCTARAEEVAGIGPVFTTLCIGASPQTSLALTACEAVDGFAANATLVLFPDTFCVSSNTTSIALSTTSCTFIDPSAIDTPGLEGGGWGRLKQNSSCTPTSDYYSLRTWPPVGIGATPTCDGLVEDVITLDSAGCSERRLVGQTAFLTLANDGPRYGVCGFRAAPCGSCTVGTGGDVHLSYEGLDVCTPYSLIPGITPPLATELSRAPPFPPSTTLSASPSPTLTPSASVSPVPGAASASPTPTTTPGRAPEAAVPSTASAAVIGSTIFAGIAVLLALIGALLWVFRARIPCLSGVGTPKRLVGDSARANSARAAGYEADGHDVNPIAWRGGEWKGAR